MKKFSLYFSVLLIVLFSSPVLADAIETTQKYAEGEVLVVLEAPAASDYSVMGAYNSYAYSWAVSSRAEGFAKTRGLEARNVYPEIARITEKSIVHLRSEHKNTEQLIRELSSDPSVINVQPNYMNKVSLTPNDPFYSLLWGMNNIGMPQVWDHFTGSAASSAPIVAVFDTGIDYNHPDINANMTLDTFGNYGRNFQGTLNNPMDIHGHGTHVAGTIGAVGNNGIGVVGVNWSTRMLAVKVLDDYGYGWDSDIINGINYVVSEKAKGLNIRVVNMSLGRLSPPEPNNSTYGTAVKSMSDAGIIVVMAAGNNSLNLNYSSYRTYPACFRFDHTITVGAIDFNSNISWFSNYGNLWVDIAAPGSNIYSTLPVNKGSYGNNEGTSMSAPHVAGAATLLAAAYPSESASQIRARILNSAKNIGVPGYWDKGTLDALGAYIVGLTPPNNIITNLPDWIVISSEYNVQFYANGTQPITWSIIDGSLPEGLEFSSSGLLHGAVEDMDYIGYYEITFKAENIAGSDTTVWSFYVWVKK
ncbi:MAG: S8 family serine peptidase [Prevotellaceae bacterium]|jgi:subtilisin family serine protease|nr:S8 family serine peptidase [Prevotellaceae bacterium]